MAAPKYSPVDPTNNPRTYASPDHVPDAWMPDRLAEIVGRQPRGARLGNPGPDQGYVLKLATIARDKIRIQPGESREDAIQGSITIALRRASLFGRAPVMTDLTVALTIWGWLLESPPSELVSKRKKLFGGLANVVHHYAEARNLVDMVPDTTFKLSPEQLTAAMPMSWRALTGA